MPIRHRGQLHGILNLESMSLEFFTPGMCAMFDAVAAQIAGAVHLAKVLNELEIANSKLQQLSMSDGLTGIANRRSFDQMLAREWSAHQQSGESLALLLVDVDCFKALNDALGHLCGDECLCALAQLCTEVANDAGAHLSRYGGEEFVLLLAAGGSAVAEKLAKTLCQRVAALRIAHPASPVASHVTVSIGVSACRPLSSIPAQSLIMSADHALYAAKAAGRNRVVVRLGTTS